MTVRASDWRHRAEGIAAGAGLIALVSVVVALADSLVDPLALTPLYLLAIVPVAVSWGLALGGVVAVASYLTYAYFFAPPAHSFRVDDADTAAALVISLVTAYIVSELARRAHARAEDARLRAQEAEDARAEARGLADEQAALRRIATLVAEGVATDELFEGVTREVGQRCNADVARMERFEPDLTVTAMAAWRRSGEAELAVGQRFALEGESIAARVLETGLPARVESFEGASGPIAREAQALGIQSSVGCPIVVGGRPWGVIAASRTAGAPFPPNTESQIADFTELVATAVSNAEARAGLVASRARLLTAADEARRRVVRDLHDGGQQRLVYTIVTLKLAKQAHEDRDEERTWELVTDALENAEQAQSELRDLAHGILPEILTDGGLAAGVEALVSRLRLPINVAVPDDRFPPEIEASAYFVVAEALTNVVKHAGAQSARVTASMDDGVLRVEVSDDGIGGARLDGSGLLGIDDRVVALGGLLQVASPVGDGTRITATLPLH